MPRTLIADLPSALNQTVTIAGWVYSRRDLGGIRFLLVRDRSGLVQCVFGKVDLPLSESCVSVSGTVVESKKAPGGLEIQAETLDIISEAVEAPPIEIPKEEWHVNPETILQYRYVSLRNLKAQASMKVQAELVAGFRAYLNDHGFSEIFSPKLVAAGAEGGANLFEVDYYGKRAYLAQSPQLYKQIMVGVLERVFEVAPVFRAEASHTVRHLAEYLSLDVEMGFIEDDGDVMDVEEGLLKAMFARVAKTCAAELALFDVSLPNIEVDFPRITLFEARDIVKKDYGHASGGKDLDPEAERLIGQWAKDNHNSDFVFITHYPQAARPFYTYPTEDGLTRGLDLIFRGTEITSGGQRIHDYHMLIDEMKKRNMDPDAFRGYLEVFKHGMPPHGGFAIGAERLTALLLGISNIRFARAFPRDGSRLHP
jgi:nondiscriminating aspartyl-tRNA synthetase